MSRCLSISDRHYTIRIYYYLILIYYLRQDQFLDWHVGWNLTVCYFLYRFIPIIVVRPTTLLNICLCIRTCVACHFSDVFTRLRDLNGINTAGVVSKILGGHSNKTLLN